MKGIILAGGKGTRLYPITLGISKQLLPVYNKPMIYYPITTLMQLGIRDIILISAPEQIENFTSLLGDGSQWGLDIQYLVQPSPDGLAQALILAEDASGHLGSSCLILGDNIFHSSTFTPSVVSDFKKTGGCLIAAYPVSDPERYGVISFEGDEPSTIEEKPAKPKSNMAVTGLYFFDGTAASKARTLSPSDRGELEIIDLINLYMDNLELDVIRLGPGTAWLDTGTFESLIDASLYIQTLEKRQGNPIGCPSTTAYLNGRITKAELKKQLSTLSPDYLSIVLD